MRRSPKDEYGNTGPPDYRGDDRNAPEYLSETSSYPQLLQPIDVAGEGGSETMESYRRQCDGWREGWPASEASWRHDEGWEGGEPMLREQDSKWLRPRPAQQQMMPDVRWGTQMDPSGESGIWATTIRAPQPPRRPAPRLSSSGVYFSTGHHYGFGPHASPRGSRPII
eukprot:Blabericola_migrator_1__10648@NODE_606_length_7355_cov_27_739572_g439_i0_p3_GENE_NODE_606_length_7355_cov_27_739572_g439_i0NODE_606_length_7355_cov_27_739572_g439_i0_p3_ORF_typecomplete_len168_score13_02_NODE_606_length_7355_cov_27_739572_g439_i030573560